MFARGRSMNAPTESNKTKSWTHHKRISACDVSNIFRDKQSAQGSCALCLCFIDLLVFSAARVLLRQLGYSGQRRVDGAVYFRNGRRKLGHRSCRPLVFNRMLSGSANRIEIGVLLINLAYTVDSLTGIVLVIYDSLRVI